jgi:hypothetical protein
MIYILHQRLLWCSKEGIDELGVWNEWERREIPRNLFGKSESKR